MVSFTKRRRTDTIDCYKKSNQRAAINEREKTERDTHTQREREREEEEERERVTE